MTISVKTVQKATEDSYDFYWGDVAYYSADQTGSLEIDGEVVEYKVLDSYSGGEGDWRSDIFVILSIGGKVFKKTGYYQSHDGSYWDGPLTEVKEIEKTVKVWDEVKPMEFTAAEVAQAVQETGDGWGEMGWGDTELTIRGETVTAKAVEYKGGEDQGSYTCVVFEVDGRLFRKEGYYASHYGTDWDGDFSEVEVFEKTVKDYREV